MYLREMGTVPLLTREGEIELARRIERGQKGVRKVLSRSPLVVQEVLYCRANAGIAFTFFGKATSKMKMTTERTTKFISDFRMGECLGFLFELPTFKHRLHCQPTCYKGDTSS